MQIYILTTKQGKIGTTCLKESAARFFRRIDAAISTVIKRIDKPSAMKIILAYPGDISASVSKLNEYKINCPKYSDNTPSAKNSNAPYIADGLVVSNKIATIPKMKKKLTIARIAGVTGSSVMVVRSKKYMTK